MSRTSSAPRTTPTAPSPGARPVVVGVDGEPHCGPALDWALAEARALGSRLELVHAHALEVGWPEMGVVATVPGAEDDHVLTDARARLTPALGDVEVTARSVGGNAARLLATASLDAEVVVVGGPRHGPLGRAVLGSTSVELAARAACPVVVVRVGLDPDVTPDRVVVGVDGSPAGEDALRAGFARAARLGLPLEVVHAWHVEYVGPSLVVPEVELDRRHVADRLRHETQAAVALVAADHPDVRFDVRVAEGDAVHLLAAASEGAETLVVGTHGRALLGGLLLGSVSQGLLRRAACPVVVVPPSAARPA